MKRKIYSVDELLVFSMCPLKRHLLSKEKNNYSYILGDEGLLLGSVLKKTFLYYLSSYATNRNVKIRSMYSKFSSLWAEHRRIHSMLGQVSKPDVEILATAYDKLSTFPDAIPSRSEIAIVNMPYTKALKDCDVTDNIDVVMTHKIGRSNRTRLELLVIDPDITHPSRTKFASRIRAVMQETNIRRELAEPNIELDTNILNIYNGEKISVSKKRQHQINYKRILGQITNSIESKINYPSATKYNCSKCIFAKSCAWSSR